MSQYNTKPGNLVLNLDAILCAVMGAGFMALSAPVSQWTALPQPLLWWAGLVLLPIAAFILLTARLAAPPSWMMGFIVLGNIGWVLLSIGLPLSGMIAPNAFGWAFLIGQAVIVAAFAAWEFTSMRRQGRLAA